MIKRIIILAGILAAAVGIGIWLKDISPAKITANPDIKGDKVLVRDDSHMIGTADAKVVLVEFGDYQCPYCGQAYQPVKTVVDKYSSNPNFTFVFRNFPLSQHPNAQEAAEAAEAAGAQGKYWEMHDLLYQNQNDWSGTFNPTDQFVSYAQQLGLDAAKFKTEVSAGKYIDNITQDQLDGEALGVNGTPTFFLNGTEFQDYSTLDQMISDALAK